MQNGFHLAIHGRTGDMIRYQKEKINDQGEVSLDEVSEAENQEVASEDTNS